MSVLAIGQLKNVVLSWARLVSASALMHLPQMLSIYSIAILMWFCEVVAECAGQNNLTGCSFTNSWMSCSVICWVVRSSNVVTKVTVTFLHRAVASTDLIQFFVTFFHLLTVSIHWCCLRSYTLLQLGNGQKSTVAAPIIIWFRLGYCCCPSIKLVAALLMHKDHLLRTSKSVRATALYFFCMQAASTGRGDLCLLLRWWQRMFHCLSSRMVLKLCVWTELTLRDCILCKVRLSENWLEKTKYMKGLAWKTFAAGM